MGNLDNRIAVESENIQQVLNSIPVKEPLKKLNAPELGGIGALIANFYNGIENILKQILLRDGRIRL